MLRRLPQKQKDIKLSVHFPLYSHSLVALMSSVLSPSTALSRAVFGLLIAGFCLALAMLVGIIASFEKHCVRRLEYDVNLVARAVEQSQV